VPEPEDPERRVHDETHRVAHALLGLALEEVVQAGRDVLDVGEEVVHAFLREARDEAAVALRDRAHDRLVERVIEPEGLAIEACPGMARVAAGGGGAAREGERGEEGGDHSHGGTFLVLHWWRNRNDRSSAATSLVSAPTEMRCTPVSATARTLSSDTP